LRPGKPLAIILPLLLVAAAAYSLVRHPAHPAEAAAGAPFRPASCARLAVPFTGVVVAPPQGQSLREFTLVSSLRPSVLEYYVVFGDRFDASRAGIAAQAGAVPLMQWNPVDSSLSAIADGSYDVYLRAFAAAVRDFDCPLMLSFGHEMNRPWFSWGARRQPAAAFVAAWRHIHGIFAAAGASNVTWVWNPNVGSSAASLRRWWPGPAYVGMVGLDGYYLSPRDTFRSIFRVTLRAVRRIAPGMRVLIAETGAYPGPGMARRVANLFAGAKAAGLAGVVYFDIARQRDWHLEDDPAALAAFGKAARGYLR
jgi:mannan endo-1,4-beta-mannosidase